MKIYRGFNDKKLAFKKRALAIGVFDGVHLGHRKILAQMLSDAKKHGIFSMVVTFDPHPAKILTPKKFHPTILMSLEHRLNFFESMGINEALVIPFTKKFAQVSREDFYDDLLTQRLGMASLTVGHDFRFGKKALGDHNFLLERAKDSGTRLFLIPALKLDDEIISSSHIRLLIEAGELEKASRMLGRPVSVMGTVEHGRGRGKLIGFPTANLNPHHEALPPAAVYSVYGYLNKKKLRGVLHIGKRPTFDDNEKSLEVHFLDFHRNIYGWNTELIFVKKIRDIRRFASPALLAKAIGQDILTARRHTR